MGPVDWTQVIRVGDECLSLLDMPSHQPCFVLIFFLLLIWEFHTILIIFNPLLQLLGQPFPLPSYPPSFLFSASPSSTPLTFLFSSLPPPIISLFMNPFFRPVCIGHLLLDLGPTVKYTNDPPSKKNWLFLSQMLSNASLSSVKGGTACPLLFYGLVFVFETGSRTGLEYTVYSRLTSNS